MTFLLVLAADAAALLIADAVTKSAIEVGGFFDALLAALLIAAVTTILDVIVGANDDGTYSLRVTHRLARRAKDRIERDLPGIVYLEIDGLAFPVLQRAMRDGNAPQMARWLTEGDFTGWVEWETGPLLAERARARRGSCSARTRTFPRSAGLRRSRGALMVCSEPGQLRGDRAAPLPRGERRSRRRRSEPR